MPSGALRVPRGSCDFDGTMDLLGERHVLVILYLLFQRSPRGFNELKVAGEVNTATLSNRLKRLEALGIIERTVIRAIPRRVEYGITPMGRDLLKIFRTMMEWKAKYLQARPPRPSRSRPARVGPPFAFRAIGSWPRSTPLPPVRRLTALATLGSFVGPAGPQRISRRTRAEVRRPPIRAAPSAETTARVGEFGPDRAFSGGMPTWGPAAGLRATPSPTQMVNTNP